MPPIDGCRTVSYKRMGWVGWYLGGVKYRAPMVLIINLTGKREKMKMF